MSYFNIFLNLLLLLKVIYIYYLINYRFFKKDKSTKIKKELFHKIFLLGMGIMLLILFTPPFNKIVSVSGEVKSFLFTLGLITIVAMDYYELFDLFNEYSYN